jgi:methylthioribose-1-phosphate isomerase
MNALELNTVVLADNKKEMIILDQTLLPGTIKYLTLSDEKDIWEAIYLLRVRGAPAIGVAAGYGIYIISSQIETDSMDEFCANFRKKKDYLASSRPTAVNLFWALNRMERVLEENRQKLTVAQMKERLCQEADAIREEDIAISRNIGRYGFELLHHGDGILTHCNAGTLATAKYGTALAPIYLALEQGWDDLHVFCDETRPLLQGARLSAFEMQTAGVDTTLLCDNMASITMKRGKINIVFVGCDRVASNGDFANKIGTSGVAILAKHYGIPFYVCAPSSTIDMSMKSGDEIVIEERPAEEVTEMWYKERMAPEGVKVCNPAFDVTDHELVTGIITEKGIAHAPFDEAFKKMGIKS